MNAALYAELVRLAHPLGLQSREEAQVWFKGTFEQAKACALLQGIGIPGEPGQPKTSRTFRLDDGRKVSVYRHTQQVVRVYLGRTKAECRAAHEAELRRQEDAEALKHAATLDKAAPEEQERIKGQPATEAEFRALAKETFWRQWLAFRLMFLGSHEKHASGFQFTEATVSVLDGFATSIAWSLEKDGTVILDEDHRNAKVRKAQAMACELDKPLQRFIEQVKAMPMEQEGGAE